VVAADQVDLVLQAVLADLAVAVHLELVRQEEQVIKVDILRSKAMMVV
jgi:hypothetical protein